MQWSSLRSLPERSHKSHGNLENRNHGSYHNESSCIIYAGTIPTTPLRSEISDWRIIGIDFNNPDIIIPCCYLPWHKVSSTVAQLYHFSKNGIAVKIRTENCKSTRIKTRWNDMRWQWQSIFGHLAPSRFTGKQLTSRPHHGQILGPVCPIGSRSSLLC